jgi:hypothetical protein
MRIVELAGSKDHRERVLNTLKNYFVINDGFKESSIVPDKNPGIIEILGQTN